MSIFLQENQLTICNLSEVEHIVSNKNFQYHEHVQFNIQTKAMIFKDSWQIYKKNKLLLLTGNDILAYYLLKTCFIIYFKATIFVW